MNHLFLEGMLPLFAPMVREVSEGHWMYYPMILTFILLASVTVMNMLVGVLVEVVRNVAEREKEAMTVIHVTNELREVMAAFLVSRLGPEVADFKRRASSMASFKSKGKDDELAQIAGQFSGDIPDMKKDTVEQFVSTPSVILVLQECGVDPVALLG